MTDLRLGVLLPVILLSAVGSTSCLKDWCDYGNCDGAGSGSGGGTGATTSQSSSSTGLPTNCDPSKLMPGQGLAATCGIFVEPGKSGGNGTQATPFGTLAEALSATSTKPIFVCATGATLDESATLTGGAQLVGALTCGTWQASATRTAWTAAANLPPLLLENPASALIQGFSITARDAAGFDAATLQGHSSVAVVVDGGTASLVDVEVASGKGAAGGDGMSETGQAPGRQGTATDFDGNIGLGCGLAAGAAKDFTCSGGAMTEGGAGGLGGLANGAGGLAGTPALGLGVAGVGDTGAMGWSCVANGGNGGFGQDGPAGNAGLKGSALGSLGGVLFYAGAAGGMGDPGQVAQGGGGGAGRKGNLFNGCGAGTKGASGASGGAGGCGGLAGQGGGAGGASIALISLDAVLTLTTVKVTASVGGAGGHGGDSQLGGAGGVGAVGGGGVACAGGNGGKGGDGGPGGGGRGGASIGLASTAVAPSLDDASITLGAAAALGGTGGNANAASNAGDAGLLMKKQGF